MQDNLQLPKLIKMKTISTILINFCPVWLKVNGDISMGAGDEQLIVKR